jgi:hypothetical protein
MTFLRLVEIFSFIFILLQFLLSSADDEKCFNLAASKKNYEMMMGE